ncbi:S41 family peptidase [Phytohabitans sp. LJ34]|uniref:S41 family peptidase n=1 Tax=Phytohabitans sp. LJ34 TaxID=3452217 RepID=UPI003F8B9C10
MISALITRLAGWLRSLPPPHERYEQLAAALVRDFGGRADPITAAACAEIERVAWRYSRHLLLTFDPDGTDPPHEVAPGWPEPDPAVIGPAAAQVREVSRLDGGACLIRVDGFDALRIAQPYLDGAFALARGATRILLDLRANGGGHPETVAYIAARLLGDQATHLSDVTYRDHTRQWWTPDLPEGTAVPVETPVAVLVSRRTFSSGEALAYHLWARGRVTVVGERTPGAADHITEIRLAPTVVGQVPIGYVTDALTGTSWEGGGVVPRVECPASEAVSAALEHGSK